METETQHAPDGEFSHSPWVEVGAFASPQHSPPMPEYSGFDFGTSTMVMDSPYGMSMPPPYATMPLPMPAHSWPSMLATNPPFPETGMHVSAHASVSPTTPMLQVRKTSTGGSTPRRTLTDEDRRQMCLYHEENKTAKQTDIGALFGVERSTVSKVLRQKEKYLNPDDGSRSAIKRAKGRVPDIEKALANWAKNYQSHGYPLNDQLIKEKALFFASTCGCPEGKEKVCTTAWLEKFKHKNNLLGAKVRRGSAPRSNSNSPTRINTNFGSALQSPTGTSPASPIDGFGSPLSPKSQEGIKRDVVDTLSDVTGGYQLGYSNSAGSIDTCSSAGMISPTSTLLSESPFSPTSQSRLSNNSNRPRSQTFPLPIDPNLLSADEHVQQPSKDKSNQPSLSIATLESPLELDESKNLFDSPKLIKRNQSNPEFKIKSMPPSSSNPISPISTPGSPTQEEARSALELLINYFEHRPATLANHEYVTMGRLMERLELTRGPAGMMNGLPRIDEHEDAPRLTKKRSIHNLG
ncbi:hypothetical protein MYU51_003331 [Penicillium brevicompactum]